MNFMPAGRQGFYEAESSPQSGSRSSVPPPPDDGEGPPAAPIQREHMFDKVVTPSDVGKLNRLVIPKQHAERYFPLDSAANEKGLLLNFEDRHGKPWRFRYSYWNSSQSYVMTKGWSRFVKDKKLDAGDTVSFHRGHLLKDRLFIDWRRRPEPLPDLHHHHFSHYRPPLPNPWGTLPYSPFLHNNTYQYQYQYQYHPSITYLPRGGTQIPVKQNTDHHRMVFEAVPVVQGNKAAAKRLRLFGVNMDCPISGEDSDNNECDLLVVSSSSAATTMPSQYHPPFDSSSPSSSSSSLARLRQNDGTDYKGKGSVSLNFDI